MKRENPFPKPTPFQKSQLREVIAVARVGAGRGWCQGTSGNFSIRGTGQLMWQSPSGVLKDRLEIGQFIPASIIDGKPVHPSGAKISDEAPLHAAIYRHMPKCQIVLHFHSPNTISWITQGRKLDFTDKEMIKAFGLASHQSRLVVPTHENSQDMELLGDRFPEIADFDVPLLMLQGHGIYGWGETPQKVFSMIEALEFLCR